MNEFLAPNGKPSNLTPEQYKLVREPAFKEWFGDWEKDPKNASKVVDENGEPLVVYHFTEKKFNVFELRGLSNGFFFTENKKDEEFSYTKKTKPYFLNIKKMSELSEMSFEQWSVPYYENEWIKKSKDGGSDGIQFIRENIDFHNKISKNKRIIVAFEPNQIKLADGTNTTFDGSNPDIRFKDGGSVLLAPNGKPSNLTPEQYKLVRTPAFKAWFGDWENDPKNSSKVVDEETKEPLVVYHGSNIDFNVFEKSKTNPYAEKQGYFFAFDKKYAESYNSKYVKPFFINIRIKGTFDDDDNLVPFNADGVVVKGLQVEVYDKNNIKLADGTNTTFDGSKPDIRFKDGGNVLLAPNGKPSNLTPEQYKLVRTPAFKKWFGDWEKEPNDNMLIDENGEPMIWWHTGGDWTKLNNDGINGKGKLMFSSTKKSMAYGRDGEQMITRPFFIKSDFIYMLPYEDRDITSAYRWNKNKKNPIWFVNAYGGIVVVRQSNQIKLADGTNTTFDGGNSDIRYADGGDVNIEVKLVNNNILSKKVLEIVTDELGSVGNPRLALLENGKVIGGIFLEPTNSYILNGKTFIEPYYEYKFDIFIIRSKRKKGYSKILLDAMIDDFVDNFPDSEQIRGEVINKKLEKSLEKYYGFSCDSGNEENISYCYLSKENALKLKYNNGGDVNFNVDRYRQVEKEMFELSTQGKTDSLEYFKLIKERSILEKNKSKENMNNNSTETFAKGGKILVKEIKDGNGGIKKVHNDFEKFGRIDIQDKYFIEASNEVGLQNVVFNKESLLAKITASFNNLLENYTDFVINKDSKSITAYIENEIKTLEREGASLDVIEREKEKINNQSDRDNVIKQIAQTQLDSLNQWVLYLRESDYPIAFRYLMLKAVIGFNYDLKLNKLFDRTDETIRNITPFDAGSLAELYTLNSNYLLQDYVQLMNDNSKIVLDSKEIIDENANGKWIKFNGGSGTSSEDIEKNGKDLMKLVQNTYWCTKSLATSQLMGGDFYVYVSEIDNEVLPQIAIRMDGNKVGEVRGNVSNRQDLSAEMLPIAKKFLLKNIPNDSGKKWLDSIQYNERCVMMRKRFETEGLYKDFIYEYIELLSQKNKYRVEYGDNGNVTLMIEKFNQAKENLPNEFYQRGEIEFDANFLSPLTKYFIGSLRRTNLSNLVQQNIDISDLSRWNLKLVSENLDCSNIITNLGNVEFIGEDLTLTSSVLNFGNIKYVGGRFDMGFAQIDSLGSIETIGGGLIVNSSLKGLGNLKKIGYLEIESCDEQFTLGQLEEIDGNFTINVKDKNIDFGNLKSVGGNFDANKTIITDLKGLESVGGSFNIAGSKIKIFPNLKTIGGDADFSNNFCSSTQDIEYILGNVKFLNSRIMEFPKLTKVGGEIDFRGSMFKTFGSVKSIGGNVKLNESKIEELGDLEEINGYASFEGTKVTTLNKLKKIVKFANFQGSNLEDLGDLESIGGNAYFNKTKIKSIGKLKYIGGFAQFDGNEELEKQWQKVQDAK